MLFRSQVVVEPCLVSLPVYGEYFFPQCFALGREVQAENAAVAVVRLAVDKALGFECFDQARDVALVTEHEIAQLAYGEPWMFAEVEECVEAGNGQIEIGQQTAVAIVEQQKYLFEDGVEGVSLVHKNDPDVAAP